MVRFGASSWSGSHKLDSYICVDFQIQPQTLNYCIYDKLFTQNTNESKICKRNVRHLPDVKSKWMPEWIVWMSIKSAHALLMSEWLSEQIQKTNVYISFVISSGVTFNEKHMFVHNKKRSCEGIIATISECSTLQCDSTRCDNTGSHTNFLGGVPVQNYRTDQHTQTTPQYHR